LGLVWGPQDYVVELELEGYKFVQTDVKNKFKAIKLSKLVVSYFDEATKKELPEVLISLSGGETYRSNNVVDKSGRITFVGLVGFQSNEIYIFFQQTDVYFVRSVLREYEFEPSSTKIHIKEGETVELKLYGKRHAYSAIGKVQTAGGYPVESVVVEAITQNCGNLQVNSL
jgi:hypothetical protein